MSLETSSAHPVRVEEHLVPVEIKNNDGLSLV